MEPVIIWHRGDSARKPWGGFLDVDHVGTRWSHITVDWPSDRHGTGPGPADEICELAHAVAEQAAKHCIARGRREVIYGARGKGHWSTYAPRAEEASVVGAWLGLGRGDERPAREYLSAGLVTDLRDGQWLDTATFAGDLIARGECHPNCLLALGPESTGCRCRCKGSWHGVLCDAVIEPR